MDKYEVANSIGSGGYGTVYAATAKDTGERVAIKKIGGNFEEGVHITTLREIKLLQELNHEHIIDLIDVFSKKQNIYLVMPLMDADLEQLIKDDSILLSQSQIKAIMKALVEAVEHMHKQRILHLDIKPSNLLLAKNKIKLIDFGFARNIDAPDVEMSPNVITRWYRPPELLFGANYYGPAADMWSVGCVFAQILLRRPFLVSQAPESDIGQLAAIFQARGTPTDANWPKASLLPTYLTFTSTPPQPLESIFTAATRDTLDLLDKLLQLNPSKRISASGALMHPYFQNDPAPAALEEIPLPIK